MAAENKRCSPALLLFFTLVPFLCVQINVTPRIPSSAQKYTLLSPFVQFIMSRLQRHGKDTEFLKRLCMQFISTVVDPKQLISNHTHGFVSNF